MKKYLAPELEIMTFNLGDNSLGNLCSGYVGDGDHGGADDGNPNSNSSKFKDFLNS